MTAPPGCMVPPTAFDESSWVAFRARPVNTAWLAEDRDGLVRFVRFDREFDGSEVTEDDNGVFITGAFVRPDHRRPGVSASLLGAGYGTTNSLACVAVRWTSNRSIRTLQRAGPATPPRCAPR